MTDLAALRRAYGDLPVVHVATVGPDGAPHVVPLWFVWREDAIYASLRRGGRTAANLRHEPRVALALERGRDWTELAGVVVHGVGSLLAPQDPLVRAPISAWHEKYRPYLAGEGFRRLTEDLADLAFLRVEPLRVTGWDHARRR